ncbi:DNA-binding transcriptional regulator DsdC [Shewanella sp. D64]|uniref:DNA-binding transcriptional regulator DsdC n=1 Tax=unclassified Shewanella TaxID=196818 RepID=UPI0022BA4C69|nr:MULTISPECIES: DNA-binding transcriptional regulator DsdC [unclassified Shewanella]MEC4726596.1 DNA-binding transcriptional regulator DsdC [Shewanella sp. D64]MEC4737363.1 DNA-binding transcriptional regulator DsdC [Shewanella sp. E94]WBJ97185.1 DNA-binding transcriptional regulator DsdC [Shewanella sp. MTB7]
MYSQQDVFTRNRLLSSYQLAKLHTFEVVARHQSFSLAAEELCVSPSAVSHRVTALEAELGFKLFSRFHRRIELTKDGKRLFLKLKDSLRSLNQEVFEIKNQEVSGKLTVYSRPSIAQCWLVPKIADFCRQYPAISINILTGNENINFNGDQIDLAIYYDNQPRSKLYCQHLMDETIMPVCSPEYAAEHDLIGKPEHLSHCTLLHDNQAWEYDSDCDEWKFWADKQGLNVEEIDRSVRFDRSDLAVIAAMNHTGVAMGRGQLVSKRIIRGELIAPFAGLQVRCEQTYYLASLDRELNPKAKLFVDWLKLKAKHTQDNI